MTVSEYMPLKENKNHEHDGFPFVRYDCYIPQIFSFYPMHWHQEMELIYVLEGQGIVGVNLENYEVETGDLMLVTPGMLHTISQKKQNAMHYINIVFDVNMLYTSSYTRFNRIFCKLAGGTRIFPVKIERTYPLSGKLKQIILEMMTVYDNCLEGFELGIQSKLYEFFYILVSNGCLEKKQIEEVSDGNRERIVRLVDYIGEHYEREITIHELAELCGFSDSHFMKFFKKYMGESCVKYINHYRLRMAEQRLLETDDPILNVALDTGFSNVSYFNRVFRSKYEMTPKEFRAVHGNRTDKKGEKHHEMG